MSAQTDMFAEQTPAPVPRVCDCWLGDGKALCDAPDYCRAWADKISATAGRS